MIRNFWFIYWCILVSLTFVKCVSPKQVEERIALERQSTSIARDSLQTTLAALKASDSLLTAARGGNELLLIAQQQLQDRLLLLDDEIEHLNGNLTNTQQNSQNQLRQLRAEKLELEQQLTQLRRKYQNIIQQYQNRLMGVSEQIAKDSTLGIVAQLRSRAGSVSVLLPSEQLFQAGSNSRLQRGADELLVPLVSILEANPLLELSIIGHTDNRQGGSSSGGARAFSATQAVSLANRLSKQFYLSAKRISAASMGDAEPLESNATEAGRAANRRIEFRFTNNVVNLLRELDKAGQTDQQ